MLFRVDVNGRMSSGEVVQSVVLAPLVFRVMLMSGCLVVRWFRFMGLVPLVFRCGVDGRMSLGEVIQSMVLVPRLEPTKDVINTCECVFIQDPETKRC